MRSNREPPSFDGYLPEARRALVLRWLDPAWQELLQGLGPQGLESVGRIAPSEPPSQLRGVAEELVRANAHAAERMASAGERDANRVAEFLGSPKALLESPEPFPLYFLGLVVTLDCTFHPRCLYCNQAHLPSRLSIEDWKRMIDEASEPTPPYVYITGGEPMLLREGIWGDEGLVAHAARRGCAVNVNSNAGLLTPEVAFQLVKNGLSRLHVSLDASDPVVQSTLFGAEGRAERALEGIRNVQVAREVLGSDHPKIHVNCVLTKLNLDGVPGLLRLIWEMRAVRLRADSEHPGRDPAFDDFAFHLIPVGGPSNASIRPTAEEWRRFHTETWDSCKAAWLEYQRSIGVPSTDLVPLEAHVPFANPFRRVEHGMSLEEYCRMASQGEYWQGALSRSCWVAPSQAYVLPDGSQHWCGAHAIQRPEPIGNVLEHGLRENIRSSMARLDGLPNVSCRSCAGATCVINQATWRTLCEHAAALVTESVQPSEDPMG